MVKVLIDSRMLEELAEQTNDKSKNKKGQIGTIIGIRTTTPIEKSPLDKPLYCISLDDGSVVYLTFDDFHFVD